MRWLASRHFSQSPKDPAFVRDPYACYAQLHRRGGPVYWEDYGLWCLCEHTAVDRTLRDRRFARLPPSGAPPAWPSHLGNFAASERHSLLALEPPEHTRLRKMVNGAFLVRKVQPMAATITRLCHDLIDGFVDALHSGETVDLLARFAAPLPVTVIARLLGMPESESPRLLAWSHAMVRIYTGQQSLAEERAADDAAREFNARLQCLIDDRRAEPGDDLVSQLLGLPAPAAEAATDETDQASRPPIRDAEIISLAILLLNAGHEATVHQIGNAVHTLLHQPPAMREQLHDAAWADRVVEEALRHDAPLHLFTRYAQTDIVLADDVTLAAGDQIALLLGAANRDPARFAEPHRFDPAREDAGHVSFGAGIHFCVGAALARLELRTALATLFERLPNLALARMPVHRDNYHFRGLHSLEVKVTSPVP